MINAIFLVAICFSLSVESLKRLVIPDPIDHPMPVLIVGIISLFINTIGLVLFRCSKCRCDRQETKTDDTYMSYPKFTSDVKMDTDAEECPNLREFFFYFSLLFNRLLPKVPCFPTLQFLMSLFFITD